MAGHLKLEELLSLDAAIDTLAGTRDHIIIPVITVVVMQVLLR